MSNKDSKSPTFCVYPWIEQVVQSTGELSFCCVAHDGGKLRKDSGEFFMAAEDKLADAWNSTAMQDIREAMLNGDKVSACKLCYFQESIGKKSYREMHNEEWQLKAGPEIAQRIEESKKNNFKIAGPALYLDLRLGNLCNLKCRSCNPYNSSQIYKEATQLMQDDPEFKTVYSKAFGDRFPETTPWFDKDEFWDEVIAAIPKIKKVYLTGGEPTLIEKNYKFLNACVESGYAKNIFIMFNTNCTNIQDKFLELLPHFEYVLINASIDGFESTNEYIRFPSRWEIIDRNFQKLLQAKGNVQIGVTPVIQVYNILTISDLLKYIENMSIKFNKRISVDFLYATHPDFLNLSILPESIKKVAATRLENFRINSKNYVTESFLTNSIDSCINLLLNSSDKFSHEHLTDFVKYTNSLDKNRKQNFQNQFPELHFLLGSENYNL